MNIKGTSLLAKALISERVEKVFGYPGGFVVDIFDELYQQDIEVILPRHEQGLIHEAEGYARTTGKVGVCIVTSGPGATNLVTGIADANYDSVPLVCFTGQVPTPLIGNDAFQEVDIVGITRSICKYGITVRDRKDLGRIIKEAFYIARTGKPGPVVIDLPKDIMLELGDSTYPKTVNMRSYKPSSGVHAGQIKKALSMLESASRPVFLIGGGVNISGAYEEMTKLVDITKVPVVTTIMGKGAIPTDYPLYIGNIGMHGSYAANTAINECDVLFSIGTRFNDRITGKISEFAKNARIIHVDIDAASISRNIIVDIPIVADAKSAIEKMLEEVKPCGNEEWNQRLINLKSENPITMKQDKGITPEKIFKEINQLFEEAILISDVGQNQMWSTQFLEMNAKKRFFTSGGLGTMGYGFPAAIGAQIGNPDKTVICIAGDGGIQMNIQEMATAVAEELPIILCIFNNGYLGMVRQWQQLFYDRRYAITCLNHRKSCSKNCKSKSEKCPVYSPNFVKLAESYDAAGIRVTKEEEIRTAFLQAMKNRTKPTVIEFMIDSEELVLPMVKSGEALQDMITGLW